MALDLLIERWFGIGLLAFGVSHLLYPAQWAALFLPLKERETGRLLLGLFNLPLGAAIVLAHNVWVWDLPVIVTLAGWMMVSKSLMYLLVPGSVAAVMPTARRMELAFRISGAAAIVLGALLVYASFFRR